MYPDDLIRKYQSKGALIDTNLLLVLFVGLFKPKLVPEFKRTETFAEDDFYTIQKIVSLFRKVVVTQSILTEVSNLLGHLNEANGQDCHRNFTNVLERFTEENSDTRELVILESFPKFGLADTGIIKQAAGKYLVFTDDFRLSNYLNSKNVDAVNFNNIRLVNWKNFLV